MIRRNLSERIMQLAMPRVVALAIVLVFTLMASGSRLQTAIAINQKEAPKSFRAVFANSTTIPFTTAAPPTPYPSTIMVSGLPDTISKTPGSVRVTIEGFNRLFPDDVGFVLVGPTGAALLLQDGVGGETETGGGTYTLSDNGAIVLPDSVTWEGGRTYKPTSYNAGETSHYFPAPGPGWGYAVPRPRGFATFSSVFGGTNPNGNWHLYAKDFVGREPNHLSVSWSLEIVAAPSATPQHVLDFDGDGKTDFAVVRPSTPTKATWLIQYNGTAGQIIRDFGSLFTDFFVPADYDGDGKTDIAIYRPGSSINSCFYILQSQSNTLRVQLIGQYGDDPTVVGDYDGDSRADPAVCRYGVAGDQNIHWLYVASTGPNEGKIIEKQLGKTTDIPAPGDYDGDGRNDFAVQHADGNDQAIFLFSCTSFTGPDIIFGKPTDVVVPGDYDGDQMTDIAVVRHSGEKLLWFILRSSDGGRLNFNVGLPNDRPTQGDYDGDGKTDGSVWRPNADPSKTLFRWLRSSDQFAGSFNWGMNGDYPLANYNVH